MRPLVFLLIFANLLFFAWAGGYFGEETRPDAHRQAQQIAPEKLVVVSSDVPPPKVAPPPAPKPLQACLAWQAVDVKSAEAIEAAAAAAGFSVGKRAVPLTVAAPNGYWVFIPPQANRAGVERKAAELRELGIKDFFVIQDEGPNRYALSLGVFSTEAAAATHLGKLKAQGVRSAVIGPRGRVDQAFAMELRGPASELAGWRDGWSGATPTACAGVAGNGT